MAQEVAPPSRRKGAPLVPAALLGEALIGRKELCALLGISRPTTRAGRCCR
jgi:hypothetical protein